MYLYPASVIAVVVTAAPIVNALLCNLEQAIGALR